MDCMILDHPKKIDVISVILAENKRDRKGKIIKMFFCCNCSKAMFQYTGKAISIMVGSTPTSPSVFLKCLQCGQIFQIVDIV